MNRSIFSIIFLILFRYIFSLFILAKLSKNRVLALTIKNSTLLISIGTSAEPIDKVELIPNYTNIVFFVNLLIRKLIIHYRA